MRGNWLRNELTGDIAFGLGILALCLVAQMLLPRFLVLAASGMVLVILFAVAMFIGRELWPKRYAYGQMVVGAALGAYAGMFADWRGFIAGGMLVFWGLDNLHRGSRS